MEPGPRSHSLAMGTEPALLEILVVVVAWVAFAGFEAFRFLRSADAHPSATVEDDLEAPSLLRGLDLPGLARSTGGPGTGPSAPHSSQSGGAATSAAPVDARFEELLKRLERVDRKLERLVAKSQVRPKLTLTVVLMAIGGVGVILITWGDGFSVLSVGGFTLTSAVFMEGVLRLVPR
jgi:hypothetical protein